MVTARYMSQQFISFFVFFFSRISSVLASAEAEADGRKLMSLGIGQKN